MSAWLWGLMASEGVFRHCTLTLNKKDANQICGIFFSSQVLDHVRQEPIQLSIYCKVLGSF